MDNRKVDGNRVGRITMDGEVTEFPMPGADRVADQHRGRPGSERLVHEGEHPGPRDPGRPITEFDVPGGGTGLTAGSDRAPVGRLGDKLWIAQSGANKIAYMSFR